MMTTHGTPRSQRRGRRFESELHLSQNQFSWCKSSPATGVAQPVMNRTVRLLPRH
jgi:hypothetical protein